MSTVLTDIVEKIKDDKIEVVGDLVCKGIQFYS